MTDTRKAISALFDDYSHEVIYIRRDEKFRCTCYVERSGESTSHCPKCFGTGYVVKVEKIRVRRKIATVPETLIGVNQLFPAGTMAPKSYQYYFEYDKNPIEGDLILEVEWDANKRPVRIIEKNLISTVNPMFGYKGRVEFINVYARYDKKVNEDEQALN